MMRSGTAAHAVRRTIVWLVMGAVMVVEPPAVGAAEESVLRIGVLLARPRAATPFSEVLPRNLRELGYAEGQNVRFEFRYGEGRTDRLADLAADLVRLKVDVIVAQDTPAVRAVKDATTTIPIVMLAGEPVATGLVASLARPGGNITGVTGTAAQISGKGLQLFREMLPRATRFGILLHRPDPFARPLLEQTHEAAERLGIELHPGVTDRPKDLNAAFSAVVRARVDGLYVQGIHATRQLAELAIRHRMPTMSHSGGFAHVGGLMGYGADIPELYREVAVYVDKILKGAKPADLPVQQPRKFQFTINLKTAKAIGVTIPQSLLLQADELVE